MFEQLAKAIAQTVVSQVIHAIGTKVADALVTALEKTRIRVTWDGEDVQVEGDINTIVDVVIEAVAIVHHKVVTDPRVTNLIDSTPDAVRVLLRAFVVGVREALIESITTQLFNEQWRHFNEGKAA